MDLHSSNKTQPLHHPCFGRAGGGAEGIVVASFLKFLFADLKAISNELRMNCLLNILIHFFSCFSHTIKCKWQLLVFSGFMMAEYCPCKDWTNFIFPSFFLSFPVVTVALEIKNYNVFHSFCPIPAIHSEFLFATGALWAPLVTPLQILHMPLLLALSGSVIPTMEIRKSSSALKIEPCERWIPERWCARSLVIRVEMFMITLVTLRAHSAKSTEAWKQTDKVVKGVCDSVTPFCHADYKFLLHWKSLLALLCCQMPLSPSPHAPSKARSLLVMPGAVAWMRRVRFVSLSWLRVQVAHDPSLSISLEGCYCC